MKSTSEITKETELETSFVNEECGDTMWDEVLVEKRYPLPPFTQETALQKVKAAEDAWNTKDPEKV